MGQTLTTPFTDKHSTFCQDDRYRVATSCMQGWRCSMEDSHTNILSLPEDPGTAFFAVFDGHGGSLVAKYASDHLHKYIVNRPEYQAGDIEESIKQGFLELDAAMQKNPELQKEPCGSTAIVVIIKDGVLYCANAGDSRAVASIKCKAEDLSVDHKPNDELEKQRIVEGGGCVEFSRVNGILALSRAFGDFAYKTNPKMPPERQVITAYPDVLVKKITSDWDFLVLACDGIWDVVNSQDVVEYYHLGLAKGLEINELCEQLMDSCLAPNSTLGGLGCDNMTVMIVCLTSGITYQDFLKKIQNNVKVNNLGDPICNRVKHFMRTGDEASSSSTPETSDETNKEEEDLK